MTQSLSSERPVPARVRPFAVATKVPLLQRLALGKEMAPTPQQYDDLVKALWMGDEPMDALVEWMFASNPREAKVLFDQAVAHGIDSVPDAPEALRAFFRVVDRDPPWLDRKLLDKGTRCMQSYGELAPMVMRDLALMVGYLQTGFNQALVLTGALSKGASQRVSETLKWWMDCTETGGMERYGVGFRATLQVRLVHAMVRRHLPKRPEWNSAEWGIPVNQTDMAATGLAFGPVLLMGLRLSGMPVTPGESHAVMHLWKYVSWLMGVEEQWLVDGELQGLRRLRHTLATQARPDWTSRELGKALAEEPFARRYPWGEGHPRLHALYLQGLYHQHLSMTSLLLSSEQMRSLGLPATTMPWYPLLTAPFRFVYHSSQRLLPPARRRLQRKGRAEQNYLMRVVFAGREQGIIQPDRDHPAHV